MKKRVWFQLRYAILPLAIVFTASVRAPHLRGQEAPGNKPETMSPMHDMAHGGAKTPSTTLTLTFGDKTVTLAAADLATMPHVTTTVTNGHTKASETYSGVPISAVLARLGVSFEKSNEHTLLKTYAIAEGTDGYKVIFSVYETLAAIRQSDAIIADTLNSKPLDKDGAFKFVVPGDTRPQRWVQNLKSLTFKTID